MSATRITLNIDHTENIFSVELAHIVHVRGGLYEKIRVSGEGSSVDSAFGRALAAYDERLAGIRMRRTRAAEVGIQNEDDARKAMKESLEVLSLSLRKGGPDAGRQ